MTISKMTSLSSVGWILAHQCGFYINGNKGEPYSRVSSLRPYKSRVFLGLV
jgi:hypothetical protein